MGGTHSCGAHSLAVCDWTPDGQEEGLEQTVESGHGPSASRDSWVLTSAVY